MGSQRMFITLTLSIVIILSIFSTVLTPPIRVRGMFITQTNFDGAVIQTSQGSSHNVSEIQVSLAAFY